MSRRNVLRSAGIAALGSGLFGCTSSAVTTSATHGSAKPTKASPTTTPEELPSVQPWQAAQSDVAPRVKLRAVRLIETAGTWKSGDGGVTRARSRVHSAGFDPALIDDLRPIVSRDDAAVVRVVVAQYGGILTETASVLVVVDQWALGHDARLTRRGTTFDVRLSANEPQWTVTTVRPARPGRPAPQISRAARRVLHDDRLRLPRAAERDARAGSIDDAVFRALTTLGHSHHLDVSVLRSGHPIRVFGTDRISDHSVGRAVDVWAIDGRRVIDVGDGPLVRNLMRAAFDAGAYQVGGPVDLDGSGVASFTDDTHQDHIHLGFLPS